MNTQAPLLLASQSPRRQQLLRDLGFEFEVLVRDVAEDIPEDLAPRAAAVVISEQKAKAYDDLSPDFLVITADTIVSIEGEILGKPKDSDDAFRMLRKLAGRTHEVITGVTMFHKGKFRSFAEETRVRFRNLTDEEIRFYIAKYEPFDKAGAYGIQDWIGMMGISGIDGDYYNVMGLPLARLYQELQIYLD